MIKEVIDPHSGAILFKEDEDTLNLKYLLKKVEELEKENKELNARVKKLEDSL